MVPRIIGKIVRHSAAAVDDLRTAKTHTSRPIKMAVPGPMTVIDSSANEFYQDEVELAFDVAAALNGELRDLQAAGADVLQIDEPAMTRYHDKVRAYGAKALDRCLDGHYRADHRAPLLRLSGRRRPAAPVSLRRRAAVADADAHLAAFTSNSAAARSIPRCCSCAATASSCSAASTRATRRCPTVDAVERRIGEVLECRRPATGLARARIAG